MVFSQPFPAQLQSLSPSRTVVTSFQPKSRSFEEGDWVLCLAVSAPAQQSLAVALSNGEVQLYDPQRLHRVATFQTRHEVRPEGKTASCVTDLKYHSNNVGGSVNDGHDPCLLWAATNAGSVYLYDLRQQAAAARAQVPASEACWAISLGFGGTVAAVAGNRKVHFLDARRLADVRSSHQEPSTSSSSPWLGCYKDAHSDHVTSLVFADSTLLLTGGEDGLVAIFDTSRPNESDALQHVWNVGSPVRKLGIAGNVPNSVIDTVWCLTGNETMSLWKPESDAIVDFPNLRQDLGPSPGSPNFPVMDYLVDAHWERSSHASHGHQPTSGLLLTAGNAQGDACVYRLTHPTSPGDPHPQRQHAWEPLHLLTGGHRGVVRGLARCSDTVMLSVGEDARLCEWIPAGPAASAPHLRSSAGTGGGGPVRRHRSRPNIGPY